MPALRTEQETLHRVVGDRAPITGQLFDQTGVAKNLTGITVIFRMVLLSAGTVKVNDQAATVVAAADGTVRYDPTANDVNAAGRYAGYFLTSETPPQRFPYDGARLLIFIKAETVSE